MNSNEKGKGSVELTADTIKNKITKSLGVDKFKDKSSRNFQALLESGNRVDFLLNVEKLFADLGAKYDPRKGSSSVGAVSIDKFSVGAAPLHKQGKKSAGLDNEDILISKLDEYLSQKPMHVVFQSKKHIFRVDNVVKVLEVGRDTADRKKSDVDLITTCGKTVPISLKKDNAEMWESSDSYWAPRAKLIIDEQLQLGTVDLSGEDIKKISPTVAVKASHEESHDVVFGSDILKQKGAVIYKTFASSDFSVADCGECIIITVTDIYRSVAEVEAGSNSVYFLIRNDSSRKWSKIYPGIRVLAVGKSRINKKVLIVDK